MSVSKNYDKEIYKKSELGLLEAKIRRFLNIKVLNEAFSRSNDGLKVRDSRLESEEVYSKLADKHAATEGKLEDELKELRKANELEIENALKGYLQQEVSLMEKFEQTFNN